LTRVASTAAGVALAESNRKSPWMFPPGTTPAPKMLLLKTSIENSVVYKRAASAATAAQSAQADAADDLAAAVAQATRTHAGAGAGNAEPKAKAKAAKAAAKSRSGKRKASAAPTGKSAALGEVDPNEFSSRSWLDDLVVCVAAPSGTDVASTSDALLTARVLAAQVGMEFCWNGTAKFKDQDRLMIAAAVVCCLLLPVPQSDCCVQGYVV
jgi:hypothetical protein